MTYLRTSPLALSGLVLLVALNGWLCLAIVGESASDHGASAEKLEWAARLPDLTFGAEPISAGKPHKHILAEPIFYKSRVPYVPPPPPPPPPPKPVAAVPFVDPGFVLGGVLISDHLKKAYLSKKADPNGVWVREGDDIGGWKLQSLTSGTARLNKESHTIEVQLYPEQ